MWDILFYLPSEIGMALRKGGKDYIFAHPWKVPVLYSEWDDVRPEAINIRDEDLITEITSRAKTHAFARIAETARANLNGKIPRDVDELQSNGIKFAFRRYQQGKMTASEFIDDLKSCAIISKIPESFWPALGEHISQSKLNKLIDAMNTLSVFHENDEQWLDKAVTYLSRVVWSQDDFSLIALASSQIAICYPKSPSKQVFIELSQRAQGLLKAREIEAEMNSLKPWQRTSPSLKRHKRMGPASGSFKKSKKDDDNVES